MSDSLKCRLAHLQIPPDRVASRRSRLDIRPPRSALRAAARPRARLPRANVPTEIEPINVKRRKRLKAKSATLRERFWFIGNSRRQKIQYARGGTGVKLLLL